MSWKKATAADYKDLLLQIRNFCTKTTDTGTVVVGGSNVGDGIIYGASSTESSVVENWTVTCLSGGSIEITGNPSPDITGTYTENGTNDGKPYYDDGTNAVWWSTANGYWYNTIIANIGTPPSDGFRLANDTAVGTWEAFGTATGVPVSAGDALPTFSVTGSVSGVQASATMLAPYSNGLLTMTILEGATPFSTGDTFTIPIASSTAEWVVDRYDTTTDPDQPELIMHGIGGGTDEIYVGINTYTNSSTYWNLGFQGFTGYVDSNDFVDQPGYDSDLAILTTASVSFDFYIWMTSRSIKVMAQIAGVDEHAYVGWLLPNTLPSQYDYPLFRGGSDPSSTNTIGDVSTQHTAYWGEGWIDRDACYFLDSSGWLRLNSAGDVYPIDSNLIRNYSEDRLGNVPLWPVTMRDESADKVFGDVEGIRFVANYFGTISSGDIMANLTEAYLVGQDVFRSGNEKIIAYDMI